MTKESKALAFREPITGLNDERQKTKWSQKRVVYSEANPPPKPKLITPEPSLTDQSQIDACDVNLIMRDFAKTGVLPGVNKEAVFADVSTATSYHDAMNIVLNAENQFMSLDAKTRKEFDNDPAHFLEFVENPKNAARLVEMGLATPRAQAPAEAAVTSANASGGKKKSPTPLASDPPSEKSED